MAKITCKLNLKDLQVIKQKGEALEKELLAANGAIYSFMLTVSNGYKTAVISGMGKTSTGVLTLKEFLGSVKSVNWEPNAPATLALKRKMGWSLNVWKASGETEKAVKVYRAKSSKTIEMFTGIDGSKDSEAYNKAIKTEFGGVSDPGGRNFDGRALFTLLNVVLADKATVDKINEAIIEAIKKSIIKVGWGS